MRVREKCKPDSEDVQIQGPRRDPHQELMLLEKLTGKYSLFLLINLLHNLHHYIEEIAKRKYYKK